MLGANNALIAVRLPKQRRHQRRRRVSNSCSPTTGLAGAAAVGWDGPSKDTVVVVAGMSQKQFLFSEA
jgi:hypothetical protein